MKKLSIALALLLVVGCGELPTDSPELTAEVTFSVVFGAAQTGPAHMELPEPLVVRAEFEGHPWKGQVVNFVVTGGGGSVFAGAALTDNKGLAQDYWTLGGPGPQVVQVRAVDSNTGAKLVFATFTAMAFEPVAITSASLTYGVIGTAYSQTVTATKLSQPQLKVVAPG